jgi:hypothetical protein
MLTGKPPVAASRIRAVVSSLVVARVLPSGAYATPLEAAGVAGQDSGVSRCRGRRCRGVVGVGVGVVGVGACGAVSPRQSSTDRTVMATVTMAVGVTMARGGRRGGLRGGRRPVAAPDSR